MAEVGVLHPGAMGAGVAGALAEAGHEVTWASEGRSAETLGRAREHGLEDRGALAGVASTADLLLSICPPHAALATAEQAVAAGYEGVYVDANATSPATAAAVAAAIEAAGGRYVDGCIVGLPPGEAELPPRLYLSGPAAEAVAALLGETPVPVRPLAGERFAASALKMCHAAWTKGTTALLLSIDDAAQGAGVSEALQGEWELLRSAFALEIERARRNAERKSWRWVGEMEEVAATFADLGLPAGFAAAAAEVFGDDRSRPR